MKKYVLFISAIGLIAASLIVQSCFAKVAAGHAAFSAVAFNKFPVLVNDTVPPADVMDIVATAVYSLNTFNIDKVADLYTPNAVVADDEPPYSWNGPTAGIQWVNAVEQVCKDNKLTKLKGTIGAINYYQQTADNLYIVVPVTYTGYLPGKQSVTAKGAFAFVLRLTNGKWLIKSQVWMPRKGL
jgi:hypothetical protein